MEEQNSNVNLLPETGADTGNYWCTWDTQYRMNTVEDGKNTLNLRDILDESFLFGRRGLLNGYFEHIRKDIYVLLDDGWDVPRHIPGNGEISAFGSLILNEERFPGFPGEPQERLRKMKERITQLGYRGLGLWICANAAGEAAKEPYSMEQSREYWKEKALWCQEAGVSYWKVDWGYHAGDSAYRDMMTEVVKQYAPGVRIEHAICRGPMDETETEASVLSKVLESSDFFRTYDVTREFNYSTAIRRAWEALRLTVNGRHGCECIVNVEDAPYLAAGLGCSMGIMRHPAWGCTKTDVLDFGRKYNEVERAVCWQRIAPPFGTGKSRNRATVKLLRDWTTSIDGPDGEGWLSHVFDDCEEIEEFAPWMITRDMDFPAVTSDGKEMPFLVCSKHPQTGAVSIAFLPRTLGERKHYTPRAKVAFDLKAFTEPIGVLGEFDTLTLSFQEELQGRIYLQDLCRDRAHDITEMLAQNKRKLVLDFDKIQGKGWLDNDCGDVSAPGFMICQLG